VVRSLPTQQALAGRSLDAIARTAVKNPGAVFVPKSWLGASLHVKGGSSFMGLAPDVQRLRREILHNDAAEAPLR
jgi:hypothetical protein